MNFAITTQASSELLLSKPWGFPVSHRSPSSGYANRSSGDVMATCVEKSAEAEAGMWKWNPSQWDFLGYFAEEG